MQVRLYTEYDAPAWDEFCQNAPQATFLHTRKFLSYHGDKFQDRSLIILDETGKWLACMPAALQPGEDKVVTSHPGISFGGLLTAPGVYGEITCQIMEKIIAFYQSDGMSKLIYKLVPTIYHKQPAADDSYALFRLNAKRIRADLTATIMLANRGSVSSRRKRSLKKAHAAGVTIKEGSDHLFGLWQVLSENLERKHGVKPVHSLEEITMLQSWFPETMHCVAAYYEEKMVAGIVIFDSLEVSHAQYIASSEQGYEVSALDAVFDYTINRAVAKNIRYFNFGISNEQQGKVLNQSLYQFKREFGAGGVVHEFYELDISA